MVQRKPEEGAGMKSGIEVLKSIYGERLVLVREKRLRLEVQPAEFISAISNFKVNGFNQLTLYTAVDWIEDKEMELVVALYSHSEKVLAFVKTRIPRNRPEVPTITTLYEVADKYEVEMAEMFGVRIIGNENAEKPFLLENWRDMPPLRKDFNSIKYATENYPARHSEERND